MLRRTRASGAARAIDMRKSVRIPAPPPTAILYAGKCSTRVAPLSGAVNAEASVLRWVTPCRPVAERAHKSKAPQESQGFTDSPVVLALSRSRHRDRRRIVDTGFRVRLLRGSSISVLLVQTSHCTHSNRRLRDAARVTTSVVCFGSGLGVVLGHPVEGGHFPFASGTSATRDARNSETVVSNQNMR